MQLTGRAVTYTDGFFYEMSSKPTESSTSILNSAETNSFDEDILTSAESNLFGGDVLSAIVLASALTFLLLVFLGIFIAYKRREEPSTGEENEYVAEYSQRANDKSKELKTIESITLQRPSYELNMQVTGTDWKEQNSYMEPWQDSDSGIYERVISFYDDLFGYEVLNRDAVVYNPYETLQ
ncbi:hypothetical protein XENTR_v10019129 [Xenopus tropicalis]|nr:hypothetical protein XENTR_v10019129 [Xenopus tropicalis]